MFSKKENFTNNIQYKIGLRIDDLKPSDFNSVDDLCDMFQAKNNESIWKPLHFLNVFYLFINTIENITNQTIQANTNLNACLNKSQQKEFINALKKNDIKPIEFSRPKTIKQIVFLFPSIAIIGSLLISTYLITAKDYSGWVYLSGLIGLILSAVLFKITAHLKTKFSPETVLEYAKSTYVIRHKTLVKNEHTPKQLKDFVLSELCLTYKKEFSSSDSIPEN